MNDKILQARVASSNNLMWRHLGWKISENATIGSYVLHAFYSVKKF